MINAREQISLYHITVQEDHWHSDTDKLGEEDNDSTTPDNYIVDLAK